jgi:hypothetical protein
MVRVFSSNFLKASGTPADHIVFNSTKSRSVHRRAVRAP